jgi:uncharacterized cupin superfamily protein
MVPFQAVDLGAKLVPAPIPSDWITSGTPVARNAIVQRSSDGSAYTMVWECTAGTFDWTYDCDETVHILEGSILLSDAGNPVRRLSAGDAVFFPKSAKVSWAVEGYVRKLAFMHDILPPPVSAGMKIWRRLRRLTQRTSRRQVAGTSGAGPVATGPTTSPVR